LTAAAWLLRSGAATTGEEAVERVRRARPSVVLGLRDIALLDAWHRHARATDAVG
jgi:protein-tyrosine phosphatase